jgi:hypothetical protein
VPFSAPTISRAALAASYSGLTVTGLWFITEPSSLLATAMGTTIYVWSLFLIVGGVLCLVGTLTKLWIGEFTGLILLFTGNAAWAFVLMGLAFSPQANNTSAKYGLALLSLSLSAFAYRWGEIREKVRDAASAGKRQRLRGRRRHES